MNQKLRKKIAGISAIFVLLSYKMGKNYHPHYEIINDGCIYASYSSGFIYIGDNEDYENLSLGEKDIFVLDGRNDIKPDMKIVDSYKIHRFEERNEILEVLCQYEKEKPSDWNRSIESMRLEWTLHNLSYLCHYHRDRSTDVDLDNEDEEKYNRKVLQKILK